MVRRTASHTDKLYRFYFSEVSRVVKVIEKESRMVGARGWRMENKGVINRFRISVLQDGKALGIGCKTR